MKKPARVSAPIGLFYALCFEREKGFELSTSTFGKVAEIRFQTFLLVTFSRKSPCRRYARIPLVTPGWTGKWVGSGQGRNRAKVYEERHCHVDGIQVCKA